jgi:hypothetical protein
MTQKKVQDIDALIASDDVEAIMAKYIQLSVQVKKLRDRLMREPGMSEIVGGLLPQPVIPPMGPAPWNPLPPVQAPLIPGPAGLPGNYVAGMQGQYQVPQEGVVDMSGTSQLGEFPMDEYIAGGADSRQGVIDLLGGMGTTS